MRVVHSLIYVQNTNSTQAAKCLAKNHFQNSLQTDSYFCSMFQFFVRLDHIRKCFTQKGGIFVLEEFSK